MNKKAMFFTLMAMLLISLFVFSLTNPKKNITGIENMGPENTRVKSLNDFVASVNTLYIPSIIQTCMYNELKKIALGQATNFNLDIESQTSFNNESVYYWFGLLNKSAAEAYHSSISLTGFKIIKLSQDQPFETNLQFSINYTVNSENKDLYWKVVYPSYNVTSTIIGLYDPLKLKTITSETYSQNNGGDNFLTKTGITNANPASSKICPTSGC